MEGSGGYLADDFLLNVHVSKDENYTKQQGESYHATQLTLQIL